MTTVTLSQLQAIEPAVLADVVRQDQRSPDFEIKSWTVSVLSDKGVANPDGLFLFSGEGCDAQGARAWSVVLKVMRPSRSEDIQNHAYDTRELLVYQSGLLNRLPRHLVPPRYYGTSDVNGTGWVWMEHVHDDSPKRWDISHYLFAAKQLGLFSAALMKDESFPHMPWFCRDSHHPSDTPVTTFKLPHVRQYLNSDDRERLGRLWDELEYFKRAQPAAAGDLPLRCEPPQPDAAARVGG